MSTRVLKVCFVTQTLAEATLHAPLSPGLSPRPPPHFPVSASYSAPSRSASAAGPCVVAKGGAAAGPARYRPSASARAPASGFRRICETRQQEHIGAKGWGQVKTWIFLLFIYKNGKSMPDRASRPWVFVRPNS